MTNERNDETADATAVRRIGILWEAPEDDDPLSSATDQPGVQTGSIEHVLAAVQALENPHP